MSQLSAALGASTVLRHTTPNTRVTNSNSLNQSRSESALAINPLNANQIVAASKKFSDPAKYKFTLACYSSQDGGASWAESPALKLLPKWDGTSDPAVTWDDHGNAYLAALPFDGQGEPFAVYVYKSADAGKTWGNPIKVHEQKNDDKQWMAGDSFATSPYRGRLHIAWDNGQIRYARSSDGGQTWTGTANQAAGSVIGIGAFPEVNIGGNGKVHIFVGGGDIGYIASSDGGDSFAPRKSVASGITNLSAVFPFAPTADFPHFPGATFRVLTLPTGCVNAGGIVMAAWADGREKSSAAAPLSRIYLARSSDDGQTWSTPLDGAPLLAAVDSNEQHFHPQLIAMPNGPIGCAFYSLKPSIGVQRISVKLSLSLDNGLTFGEPYTLTDMSWDPAIGAPLAHGNPNVTFIGEYFGFDASYKGFRALWTDTRTGMQELFTADAHVESGIRRIIDSYINVLVGVINDAGGFGIAPGGGIVPIDPWGPEMELLKSVVIHGIAATMQGETATNVQRDAMKLAGEAASAQVERLTQLSGDAGNAAGMMIENPSATVAAARRKKPDVTKLSAGERSAAGRRARLRGAQ